MFTGVYNYIQLQPWNIIFNITFIILNIIFFSIAPHLVYNEQKNINEYINIPLLKKSLLQNRFEQFAQKI